MSSKFWVSASTGKKIGRSRLNLCKQVQMEVVYSKPLMGKMNPFWIALQYHIQCIKVIYNLTLRGQKILHLGRWMIKQMFGDRVRKLFPLIQQKRNFKIWQKNLRKQERTNLSPTKKPSQSLLRQQNHKNSGKSSVLYKNLIN